MEQTRKTDGQFCFEAWCRRYNHETSSYTIEKWKDYTPDEKRPWELMAEDFKGRVVAEMEKSGWYYDYNF